MFPRAEGSCWQRVERWVTRETPETLLDELAALDGWPHLRNVAETIATTTAWSKPSIPVAGDPVAFHGTPALG